MSLNTKNTIEFLILIAGPLFQNIAYFILIYLFPYDKELILIYHISLLVFNLLPIYPLDGGKLLNLFINNFLPYKKTLKLIIKISYLLVFIIFIIQKNITINILVMLLFLLVVIHKEENKVDYIYNKFLLERYLNKYKFKHSKIINSKEKFYRNRRHLIKVGDKYYLEDEYLEKKYRNYKKSVDYLKSTML